MMMKKLFLAGTAAAALTTGAAQAQDVDCPIKVGVLHSLSGTMAISETTLKDVMLMLIEQQNEFTIKLKDLEDNLLAMLANAEGDILGAAGVESAGRAGDGLAQAVRHAEHPLRCQQLLHRDARRERRPIASSSSRPICTPITASCTRSIGGRNGHLARRECERIN